MQAPDDKKGFIKLPRWIMDSDLYVHQKFDKCRAFIHLVMAATYKEKRQLKNGYYYNLKPGQLVTTQRELATKFGWNKDTVGRFLDRLQKMEHIEIDATPYATVISVLNYQYFQGFEPNGKIQSETPMGTEKGTRIGTPKGTEKGTPKGTYIKNIKNNKEVEEGASATTSVFSLNAITTWRKFRRGYQPSTRDKEHLDILQDIIQDRIKATQGKTYSEEQLIEVWETVLEHLPEHKKGKDLWMIIEDFDEIANQVSYSLEKEYQ